MSIIKAFTNLALDKEKELAKTRKSICKGCYVSEYGNSRFCKIKNGGCGCLWSVKARDPEEECPLDKWPKIDKIK